ncbi:hypothetical protein Ocin01_03856 [Orchesella cincta]|uniref:Uncharacterized protein n=1 Tax=Orchesella cincta TaxID=48709 RepID=A0A1D2NC75_ORCCI|nr:hypothetical protein Ocin01_03856 [Orchesella cincta]
MSKLDLLDLFQASMKQPLKLLDLSNVKIDSDADFLKYMNKVPEMKLRPDKVLPEDIQIITDFSFASPTKQQQEVSSTTVSSGSKSKKISYEDPLPLCMRTTRLEELWALDIHWKMLTSDRPSSKIEAFFFERIVELGRFALADRKQEQATIKAIMSSVVGTPAVTYLIALGFITTRSKRGAVETKLKVCKNCGLELCTGAFCKVYHYEGYTRMILDDDELENQEKDKDELAFLKQVSGAAAASSGGASGKKAQTSKNLQGKKLKMQIKKTKRKKKKKKKAKENVEAVSAPE